jgi:hypothetical protein
MKIDWDKFRSPEAQGNFGFEVEGRDNGKAYAEWWSRIQPIREDMLKLRDSTALYSSLPTKKSNSDYASILKRMKKYPEESIHIIVNSLLHGHGWNSICLLHDLIGDEFPQVDDHAGKFTWKVIDILTWYQNKLEEEPNVKT